MKTISELMGRYDIADARHAVDVKILYSPQMTNVYRFGHEFGEVGYIVAGDMSDAWDEMLSHIVEVDGVCDHGGEITDEQRWAIHSGEAPADATGACDCELTDDGRWVDPGYWWCHHTDLKPEFIELAFCYQEEN